MLLREGTIVHYVIRGQDNENPMVERPAIITRVYSRDTRVVNLWVVPDVGEEASHRSSVEPDMGLQPATGTWHWA